VIVREIQLRAVVRGQPITLSAEELDAIAEQVEEDVVDLRRRVGLVDARTLAAELGVARDWVYTNADRLGGVRLGDGPRGAAAVRRGAGARSGERSRHCGQGER
jgi:hypothetical protein